MPETSLVIKISAGHQEMADLFARQTSKLSRTWNGIKFEINQPIDKCDWWVVCHSSGLPVQEEVICDPDHLVFISMEPPAWGCPCDFFDQFSHLISCDRSTRHRNQTYKNGLTWWVGLKVKFENGHKISSTYSFDYDSLMALELPKKENKISVITSVGKNFPGHKKRLKFLDKLSSNAISKHIDFFGGHRNPVEDKMDALAGYQYHLALENSVVPDYWTEKLADPLLAWCLPIYYGCPNVDDYFPRGSLIPIDINNFDSTVRALWELLESDLYSRSIDKIDVARNLVLNDFNIFQLIADICNVPANQSEKCCLLPLSSCSGRSARIDRKIIRKCRSSISKLSRYFPS